MMDDRSEKNISTLLPEVRPLFRECLAELKDYFKQEGIEVIAICGNRTFSEQDALYAQGRTSKGPKVTNARGGYSNHNFGIAIDIGLFKDGKYLTDSKLYKRIGPIVRKFPSLEWGGNWKDLIDTPHIQYRLPHSLAELREQMSKKAVIV